MLSTRAWMPLHLTDQLSAVGRRCAGKPAKDSEGEVYYFNVHTSEARWTKPSHDKEVGEFLHRHGVHSDVAGDANQAQHYSTEMLTVNVSLALKKLRERSQWRAGRRSFVLFAVYLGLLFGLWGQLADIGNSQGVEMGLRSRINAIQFEVTPGPHLSQSIRATSWEGVRNLGDLHDWTLAAVENLYSDDDFTYSTPEDRAEMKRRSLADSWHNSEYTELWGALGIDTDPEGLRHNCSDWLLETQESTGTWEMPCEFYERCGGLMDDLGRVVALGGDAATAGFENKSVECAHSGCARGLDRLEDAGCIDSGTGVLSRCGDADCKSEHRMADLSGRCAEWLAAQPAAPAADNLTACLLETDPTDAQCREAAEGASGLSLRRKCEEVSGCRYMKELWREECVSSSAADQWREWGPSYDSGRHVGNVNLYNKPMPWVVLKMHRRSNTSPEEQCASDAPGCFSSESDTSNFTGAETGFVYSYNSELDAFPFFIRLDDEAPERWLGLLEVLRADRWLSTQTLDFTMECLVWNTNSQVLGSWSLQWVIDSGGQIKKPSGLLLRSFPLTVADPSRRDPGVTWLLVLVMLGLSIELCSVLRRLYTTFCYKEYLQMLNHASKLKKWELVALHYVDLFNLGAIITAWVGTLWFTCNWFSSSSKLELSELETDLQPFSFSGVQSELDEKLELLKHTQHALETWCIFRDLFGIFCMFAALRCLIAMTFMRKLEVFFDTLLHSRDQLSYFVLLMVSSGFVFTEICYLFFGRRFFAFRSLQPTMFAIMGPVLGGNSNLEDAVLESSRHGDTYSSIVLYWSYTAWIILLIYNVLIAILVDGYEEAKDREENKRSIQKKGNTSDVEKLNAMLETVMTQKVEVPACASNVWYIKVPDVKVYSCGSVPLQESRSLDGYEFAVSVVEPWQGILKSNSSASRTSKASFVYVVKVERINAPSGANDGWPEGFTLQALVKRRRNRGKKGEWKNDTAEGLSGLWTACLKWWRTLEARAARREKTEEERWARSGIDYLDEVLSEFINDKIDLLTRDMMTDGSLDQNDSEELEQFAAERDLNATHGFITEHMKDLQNKIKAALTSERRKLDPTVKNRLERLNAQLDRVKVIEQVARTDLSHQDIVEALSKDRKHPVIGDKGVITYEDRASHRCPGPLIKLFWKAFATVEDEELEETSAGPPATWQQMDKLDDKVTAMMQLDMVPDTDSTNLVRLGTTAPARRPSF